MDATTTDTATTQAQTIPTATITKDDAPVTQITTILVRPRDQARLADALVAHTRTVTATWPGLRSASVHRSTDGARLLVYGQWDSLADLHAAEGAAMFPLRGLAIAGDPHVVDVVYTDDTTPAGVTAISADNPWATFINVMHTTPDQQGALVDFVVGNDAVTFARHPGYRSANFHRSRDGERVVNYSHWESEAAFLDAINTMFRVPGLTMGRANELAADAAGERGWTDFRFYTVDAVVTP